MQELVEKSFRDIFEFIHGSQSIKFSGNYDEPPINAEFQKSKVAIRKHYFRDNAFYSHMELDDFQRLREGIFEELKKSLDYYLKGLG